MWDAHFKKDQMLIDIYLMFTIFTNPVKHVTMLAFAN